MRNLKLCKKPEQEKQKKAVLQEIQFGSEQVTFWKQCSVVQCLDVNEGLVRPTTAVKRLDETGNELVNKEKG